MSFQSNITYEFDRLNGCPPPLVEEESLLGYLLRLTTLNGYKRIRQLLKISESDSLPLNFQKFDLRPLAVLVNQSEEKLRSLAYNLEGKGHKNFLGHVIGSSLITHKRPQLCMDCLRERFVFKAFWDLSLVVCCPEHGGYLLSDCPMCGRRLKWYRPEWNRCRCGYDFNFYEHMPAPREIVEFTQLLNSHFAKNENCSTVASWLSKYVGIPPAELMYLFALLGQWSFYGRHETLNSLFFESCLEERAGLILSASRVLKDWPKSFYEFLDCVKGQDPCRTTKIIMYRDFGRLYYLLMYIYKHPSLDFVRKALNDYDEHQRARFNRQVESLEEIDDVKFFGPSKAIGVSAVSMKKMAVNGGVSFKESKPKGVSRVVEVSDECIDDLKLRMSDRIRYMDVVKILDVSPSAVRNLIDGGLLTKDKKTILDGRGEASYSRKELEGIFSQLNEVSELLPDLEINPKIRPLMRALQVYSNPNLTAYEVIKAVLDKRIDSFSTQIIKSFRDVYVNSDDLKSIILHEVLRGESGYITIFQASEKYSIAISNLECLLKNKAIDYKLKTFGNRKYSLIKETCITDFFEKNVMATGAAKYLRKHHSKIGRLLASNGVTPLWAPKASDQCKWYRWVEIKQLHIQ